MANTFGGMGAGISGGDFPVAPDGIYKCRLTDDSPKPAEKISDYPDTKGQTLYEFRWFFETTEVGDDEGKPFRFIITTNRKYGDNKGRITQLLDTMLKTRLTEDEFLNYDIDSLRPRDWAVNVSKGTNTKTGKPTNNIENVKPWEDHAGAGVKPLKPLAKAVAAPVPASSSQVGADFPDDGLGDPFSEE